MVIVTTIFLLGAVVFQSVYNVYVSPTPYSFHCLYTSMQVFNCFSLCQLLLSFFLCQNRASNSYISACLDQLLYLLWLFCFFKSKNDLVVSVDASLAGKGRLEIDSGLPILKYEKTDERIYSCSFVPKKTGKYDILAKYNGVMVEGSVQDNHSNE